MTSRRRCWVAGALAAALLVGCGADERSAVADPPTDTTDAPAQAHDDRPSPPFTVDAVPEGFVLRAVGEGTGTQGWGEDCCGSDEPYTVLSPDGTGADPDAVVVVSVTGFEGYEGGLDQASGGYTRDDLESDAVDGRPARFIGAQPATADLPPQWADLVVDHGDGLAVRVTSPLATREDLEAVHARVTPAADRGLAPGVPEPPPGLEVVGSVDAAGVLAGRSYLDHLDAGPGPVGAHGIGWVRGPDELMVMTLPPGAADLSAIAAASPHWDRWEDVTVGRSDDQLVIESSRSFEPTVERSVWIARDDALVVVVARGEDPPAEEVLVALARSVAPTEEATWDAFVTEANGGPGLRADPGRTELARGTTPDGVDWVLQDTDPAEDPVAVDMAGLSGEVVWRVDDCLKVDLPESSRACPQSGWGDGQTRVGSASDVDWIPIDFVLVATLAPTAASLVVVTDGVTETVPLVPVPGSVQRAGVVTGPGYQVTACATQEAPATGPRTVTLVDAAGAPLPCPS